MTETIEEIDGVEIVERELVAFKGDAVLVRLENDVQVIGEDEGVTTQYFIVSGVETPFSGWQCIAFAADGEGTPINFRDHAGGADCSHAEVFSELVDLAGGGVN